MNKNICINLNTLRYNTGYYSMNNNPVTSIDVCAFNNDYNVLTIKYIRLLIMTGDGIIKFSDLNKYYEKILMYNCKKYHIKLEINNG